MDYLFAYTLRNNATDSEWFLNTRNLTKNVRLNTILETLVPRPMTSIKKAFKLFWNFNIYWTNFLQCLLSLKEIPWLDYTTDCIPKESSFRFFLLPRTSKFFFTSFDDNGCTIVDIYVFLSTTQMLVPKELKFFHSIAVRRRKIAVFCTWLKNNNVERFYCPLDCEICLNRYCYTNEDSYVGVIRYKWHYFSRSWDTQIGN